MFIADSRKVTDALSYTASEYHDIGNLFDAHTKKDMEPVVENLFSYKGTVQAVPDILSVHKVREGRKGRRNEGMNFSKWWPSTETQR